MRSRTVSYAWPGNTGSDYAPTPTIAQPRWRPTSPKSNGFRKAARMPNSEDCSTKGKSCLYSYGARRISYSPQQPLLFLLQTRKLPRQARSQFQKTLSAPPAKKSHVSIQSAIDCQWSVLKDLQGIRRRFGAFSSWRSHRSPYLVLLGVPKIKSGGDTNPGSPTQTTHSVTETGRRGLRQRRGGT